MTLPDGRYLMRCLMAVDLLHFDDTGFGRWLRECVYACGKRGFSNKTNQTSCISNFEIHLGSKDMVPVKFSCCSPIYLHP
jgi:hypothetical protein